ncbi:MAG TPA: hypothetical protein VLJ62_27445 [Burkholderiaceae bacterium]|nr:hypothetical protein [Burkholderiaceae bacterium]
MTQSTTFQRRAMPWLLAAVASLSLLAGCDRRAADPAAPSTGTTTTPPPAETVPGTTPGAMPPASGASG